MEFSEGVNYTILVNNADKVFLENFRSYKVLDTMEGFGAIKSQVEVFLSKRIVFNEIWYYLSKEEKSELLEILKRRNDSNKVVIFEGSKELIDTIIDLKIISEHMWYLKGQII